MLRGFMICVAMAAVSMSAGCLGDESNELAIPKLAVTNGGTSEVSPQFGSLGGVPEGVQVAYIGDVIVLRGIHFREDMKFFLGLNIELARRPDSLMTMDRHRLPDTPFVYTDPVTGQETILEVEAPVEFSKTNEVRVTIPPAVACSPAFTNPIVRMYGDAGSSYPTADVLHIVGPRCIALTPSRGVDIGGYDVVVHGDFLSMYTQVAIRYPDPVTGEIRVLGDQPDDDINELFIDRHTLVIPDWPGIVPNSTLGLAEELEADLLLFENVDAIAESIALEPNLDGVAACDALRPESPEAPLFPNGVRNSEKANAFTFLPTGVTDFPSIAGIVPESGPEIGGNTVIIQGDQFDAFSADLSDPANPGIGIECPPDSGQFIPPLEATLVDRQTLVIKMPPCAVDVPETVDFCIRNKFSIDRPGQVPSAGPSGDCVVFEDIYTYIPIPPIVPPVVTAIYPADEDGRGTAHDYGLERLFVVGDWSVGATTLNGGFEFLLPDPEGGDPIPVQSQRTILHNRNLVEVFTKRLPEPFYPLSEDLLAGVRVRNTVGHADFEDVMVFEATPDAGAPPVLEELCETSGPLEGGNDVLLFGANFDTSTQVFFGEIEAEDVQFLGAGILAAKAPPGAAGEVGVSVVDDGDASGALDYTYAEGARSCPALALLEPDSGTQTGGFDILAYGANLTPTTRVEFGVDSGNFSYGTFFVSSNLLRVVVPEALTEQVGIPIGVGATDPLAGCEDVLKTVDFTFTQPPGSVPEILFVDTTVVDPPTPTDLPALKVGGGTRMLVIGRNFDQATTFDLEKPIESGETESATEVRVLSPNIAVMTAPASPDGLPGIADLQAHNAFGDSNEFPVEYVQPGPPSIVDVRNLDDGTTTAPIDANERLLIFGDNFFVPLTVTLTGCDPADPEGEAKVLVLDEDDVTLVEDHLIGLNIPPNTFCQGPLAIEVTTDFGTTAFEDEEGDPIFELIGPQPPIVSGVFPSRFRSAGGEEAVFFGRFFTPTTRFSVRTDLSAGGAFTPVLSTRVVSENTAIVVMPSLPGGMPPAGVDGDVRAEETDPTLRAKITSGSNPPVEPFSITEDLFTVVNDEGPLLLGVFPDHGSIDGGEQVLLLGENFLTATGASNVTSIRLFDPVLGADVGTYTEAASGDLPLDSLDPANRGKFVILNDHEILLITNPHAPLAAGSTGAPVTVIVGAESGSSQLVGGYTYLNTPAVVTPMLLGITPNETRLNGGTSHLVSGGFLTSADRLVLTRPGDGATFTLDTDDFAEVNDTFVVFVMPDLSGTFDEGDVLDVRAEKDVDGSTLVSNTLLAALRVSFAGPPFITPDLAPDAGGAFGGTVVEFTGGFFTSNSQVLFGTIPARTVVFAAADRLLAVAPSLPLSAPAPGTDLTNLPTGGETVDVAVFTQGGWAVLEDGFTFEPQPPVVTSCSPHEVAENATVRVTVVGDFFVPGEATATPMLAGATTSNLAVESFQRLAFDYHAPDLTTSASVTDQITIATNQGTATTKCSIEVLPDPTFDDGPGACTTTYTPNTHASPTTGVHKTKFVVVTLSGENLSAGGSLEVTPRAGAAVALQEIGAADAFTKQGQFRVIDDETIEFSAPNVFPSQVPTLIDGNPNVGPATIRYENAAGRSATLADCFHYVPSLLDFEEYGFPIPNVDPPWTTPDKLAVGDLNADGLPDVVALAREFTTNLQEPELFVFVADTFGTTDVNGDGKTPDFAGTFTRFVVENDLFKTNLYLHGRGSIPRLGNFDDDDELEIVVPGSAGGTNAARVLIVDVEVDTNGDVTFPAQTVLTPASTTDTEAVAGIAIGTFDDAHDGTDIAIVTGSESEANRKVIVFGSTATPFSFDETATDIDDPFDDFTAGALEAGDFDGDGDDDLVWGQAGADDGTLDVRAFPIVVAEIDASTATVVSQDAVTNLTGGSVWGIVTFDADGDDKEDAFVLVQNRAKGSFFGGDEDDSGIAVLLDPFGLEVDAYLEGGFQNDGPIVAKGDFNGDGILDLAPHSSKGEFVLFLGDGEGGFHDAGRSWILVTVQDDGLSRTHGIAAGDVNHDGLDEVFMGDTGFNPMRIVIFLNRSR